MSLESLNSARVEACLALASEAFGQTFPYNEIRYDLRGKAAGQLVMHRRAFRAPLPDFRFNKTLLEKYADSFIEQVVPHECAHLVAFSVYGTKIKPHGVEWKQVMQDVYKLPPLVRHNFEVETARQLQRFDYRCQCSEKIHQLTSIRHNKVKRGKAQYRCKTCHTTIAWQGR